jgi:hypothetical protein
MVTPLPYARPCHVLIVRYDQHVADFRGRLQLACALLWFRRLLHLSF